jgi:thioredoxin-dependent peroxiredoxin
MSLPKVTFKIREGDIGEDGGCTFEGGRWIEKTTDDLFKGKRVVVFSLPGAFTPTCTSKQLPGFENNYNEFKKHFIDEIYCISVNDTFVMNAWAHNENLKNVKVIPDGSGQFTRQMGMLVDKDNKGFGYRSWRYAMIVNDGIIEKIFEEPGKSDNFGEDPYGESSPENVLMWLEQGKINN